MINGILRQREGLILRNSTSFAFSILKQAWKFPHTFPELQYVEANPILDVYGNRRYGSLIEEYWAELYHRGGMITWSQHTVDEVNDVISGYKYTDYAIQNGIKEQILSDGNKIPAHKVAENTVPDPISIQIALSVQKDTNDIFNKLRQYGLPIENIPIEEVDELTKYLHGKYGGTRKDAKHIAWANLGGTNDILSNDCGLLRFPSVNIYGASWVLRNEMVPHQNPVQFVDLSQFITALNT